jgi:aerobic-type carbon monoxide dehydrogenase small subunit (CoxS/CutS family)
MSLLTLIVNGSSHRVETPPDETLLWVLRDRLGLTGTRYGCGEGQCGACTVLIDGRPVRSCLAAVSAAAGRKITTIEGLERGGDLHPVQTAFLEHQAFQCAYCTSGMILTAAALLERKPDPKDEEIIDAMKGNICRCGTYPRILASVRQAAAAMRKGAAR